MAGMRTTVPCSCVGSWISLAAALSVCSFAHAGPGVWTTGGPYGGTVRALAIASRNPSTLVSVPGSGGEMG